MSELENGLTRIFLAGVGALAVTAEKSKEVVDELVKKGELTVEQGKILNEELKRDAAAKVKEAVASIQSPESVEKIMGRVDEMTPEERAALKAKLEEADRKAAEAQSGEEAAVRAEETHSEQA
ncbi:hypothetical protein DW094_04735 [Ruminococcaceae bacterium AM07-15]|nr:hypothetical protein DW094_04735 [Ruminococcaceae bacterium AM07-15]